MKSIFQLPSRNRDHSRDEPMANILANAAAVDLVPANEGSWQSLDILRGQMFAAADHRNDLRERMGRLEQELQAAENAVHEAQRRLDTEIEKSKVEVL